jgi:protocatechuate 3,4-dioxygenase beta subunit
MRTLLLTLMVFAFLQAPPVSNPLDNGTVEGSVIWASQSRPLEGIPVYLRKDAENVQDSTRRGVSVSDGSGRFILRNIPPGEYIVVTNRQGYLRESDADVRVTVTPRASIRDVTVRMIVGGSISGRVVDVNGLGLAEAGVSAAQPGYLNTGQRQLQQRSSSTSDDRGEFRIRGLRPGTYYVRADMPFWASDSATFYPGVKDEASAVPVTVKEAQDTTVNLRVEARLKPVMTISGTVTSPVTGVPANVVERILIAGNNNEFTYYDNRAEDRTNGRFEIRNIYPGNYDLFPDARDADGKLYTSRTNVEVIDRSIENVTLPAMPLINGKGRMTYNGDPPGRRLNNPALRFQVVRGIQPFAMGAPNSSQGPSTMVTPDADTGEFVISAMAPGIYKITPTPQSLPDAYVEDVRQGVKSVYQDGFTVSDQSTQPIDVHLAGPGGKIEGIVRTGNQEPAVRAMVVLVPEAAKRQDLARFKTAQADKDGKFILRAIVPGNYTVLAWESVPQSAWFNAEFMKKFESRGQPITIERGASTGMQLTALPRED